MWIVGGKKGRRSNVLTNIHQYSCQTCCYKDTYFNSQSLVKYISTCAYLYRHNNVDNGMLIILNITYYSVLASSNLQINSNFIA